MPNGTFVLADIGGYTTFLTDAVRQRAENDVRGLKALCEAEARGTHEAGDHDQG